MILLNYLIDFWLGWYSFFINILVQQAQIIRFLVHKIVPHLELEFMDC